MLRYRHLALAPLALLAACGGADTSAVVETVRMTEQAQLEALAAKDLDGITRNYEAGAVLVLPGRSPLDGADAIRGAYEQLLSDPHAKLEVQAGAAWAAESGDLAVTTATGQITMTDASGAATTTPLTNQTVWRRSAGDPWKIVSEVNAVPAAASAPAAVSARPAAN